MQGVKVNPFLLSTIDHKFYMPMIQGKIRQELSELLNVTISLCPGSSTGL